MNHVELIYHQQADGFYHVCIPWQPTLTVADAMRISGFSQLYPEAATYTVAVFGQSMDKDGLLNPGDRLEICRPLTDNPMQKRRKRVNAESA